MANQQDPNKPQNNEPQNNENEQDKQDRIRANGLKAMKTQLDEYQVRKDVYNSMAMTIKMKYDGLMRAGFTDQQAIFLCLQDWA